MAKLMKAGKVHEDWESYISEADTYLEDFDYKEDTFTCESAHFASPEDDPPKASENDDTGETPEPEKPAESEEPTEPEGPKTLKFSSKHNSASFGDPEPVVDEETGGVAMGLDPGSANGWIDLDGALEMFEISGPDAPKKNPLENIFAVLRTLKVLEIDGERAGNGFWVLPKIEKKKVEEPAKVDGGAPKIADRTGDGKAVKKMDTTTETKSEKPEDKSDDKVEAEEVEVKSLDVGTFPAVPLAFQIARSRCMIKN